MELNVKHKSFPAETIIDTIVSKPDSRTGNPYVVGAFGRRTDTEEKVYISGRCVAVANLAQGDTVDVEMVPNHRYMQGLSDCKYYGFYAHVEAEEDDAESDGDQFALFEWGDAEDEEGYRNVKTPEIRKVDELLEMGGIWNALKLTNAVLRANYRSSSEMTKDQKRLFNRVAVYILYHHKKGNLARIDMRSSAEQTVASYTFYTKRLAEVAHAMMDAK